MDNSQVEGLGTPGVPLGGVLTVQSAEPPTYSATANAFVPIATAATDVFTISGSATKIIRIHKVRVSATTTSGSAIKLTVAAIKRSTANVGGTSAVVANVSHDSLDAAGTAVARSYTANPTTLGTAVGTVRGDATSVAANGILNILEWIFNDVTSKPLVLRGVAENFCINFGGASITGPVASVSVEWSEV